MATSSGGRADPSVTSGVLDFSALFAGIPTAYLVMDRDLVIVEANDAYLSLLGYRREQLVGRAVFEAFPPEPSALAADGSNPLQTSFERARDTGVADQMPLLNYDVVSPVTGVVEQRYWSLISAPILGDDGVARWIVQRVEDVTAYVAERHARRAEQEAGAAWQQRAESVQAELFIRAQEVRAAVDAQQVTGRRLAALAQVALRLATAETVHELTEIVAGAGFAALGADGGAIAIRDTGAHGELVRLTIADFGNDPSRQRRDELPLDTRLPAPWVASTGQRLLLPDRASGLSWSPLMAELQETTGRLAWAALPLRSGNRVLGALVANWTSERLFAAGEVELLTAFAAQCGQALDRLQVRAAERLTAAVSREMSEALQRSLLTNPPDVEHLEMVARYVPASAGAQVGGDWHDAFHTPDGQITLVIGDTTGHDRNAAAAMAQVRNLTRGVAQSVEEPPAAVLSALDRALRVLQVDTLATAVIAQIHRDQLGDTDRTVLHWSNAGHLPPVLIHPDGSVELLDDEPDLLLGVQPDAPRVDRSRVLAHGTTLLLYTDGLVERRGEGLDDGLHRMVDLTKTLADQTLAVLCDRLLRELAHEAEDDVALLAVRFRTATGDK